MNRFWLQTACFFLLITFVFRQPDLIIKHTSSLGISEQSRPFHDPYYAQESATETPPLNGVSPYITQTYTEQINVRTGPSTVDYPIIGILPVGATAPALATSPHHEWIEISFPSGPGGVGWIYAANVTLTGTLQIVEPPPTPTPVATATIDPTLVAAFNIQPTETRLPTFTPAPPLIVPTYIDPIEPVAGFPIGGAILVLALVGVLVLVVSFFIRR